MLDDEWPRLPVHKSYLFTMLVMGRFHKGKRLKSRTVFPTQSGVQPPASIATDITTQAAVRDGDKGPPHCLHGLTGSMEFGTTPRRPFDTEGIVNGHVHFSPQLPNFLKQDGLSPSATILLALGIVLLPSGQCLYLANPQGLARAADDSTGDPGSSDSSNVQLFFSSFQNPAQAAEQRAQVTMRKLELEVYDLQKTTLGPSWPLSNISSPPAHVSALHRVDLSHTDQGSLQEMASMTYVPPESQHVRVYPSKSKSSMKRDREIRYQGEEESRNQQGDWECVFMTRQSAQFVAMILLSLPWSRKNYIIGMAAGSSILLGILLQASPTAMKFLLRLKKSLAILHLDQGGSTAFLAAADKVLQSDASITDLCDLDETLAALQHPIREVSLMLSVLLLTNIEFCALVYQSLRHAHSHANTQATKTELDLDLGKVTVVGAFGISHVFVVDLDHLLPHLPGHRPSQTRIIKVDFAVVLLAATKAFTRSLMLMQRIDVGDIEKAMSFEGDEFTMS